MRSWRAESSILPADMPADKGDTFLDKEDTVPNRVPPQRFRKIARQHDRARQESQLQWIDLDFGASRFQPQQTCVGDLCALDVDGY